MKGRKQLSHMRSTFVNRSRGTQFWPTLTTECQYIVHQCGPLCHVQLSVVANESVLCLSLDGSLSENMGRCQRNTVVPHAVRG